MYHRGNRELQTHFGSEALADRLFERTSSHAVHRGRQGIHRKLRLLLSCDRGQRCSARLLVQRWGSGFRQGPRARFARLPRLRRQWHVQESGQYEDQSQSRTFVHRDGRKAQTFCASMGLRNCRSTIPGSRIFPAANCWCASRRRISSRIARGYIPHTQLVAPSAYVPQATASPIEAGMENRFRLQGRGTEAQADGVRGGSLFERPIKPYIPRH